MMNRITQQPAGSSARPRWYGIALALATVLGAALMSMTPAHGQTSNLEIVPLAQGFSTKHQVRLHATGPNDILQARLIFRQGGDTGWHTHPGPVIVVVKKGALTEVEGNGCVVVHPAGSVFYEAEGEVHRAFNQTGEVTEVIATFISPAGAPPLQPAPDPGPGSCRE